MDQANPGQPRRRRIRETSPGYPSASDAGEPEQYDPLDYANLARSCVLKLMAQPVRQFPLENAFLGAGVYALFYTGDFPPYGPVESPDATRPIYVGKAEPAGGRKGGARGAAAVGAELYGRIIDHITSIRAVSNLRVEDFLCRYLIVVPLWIRMVERFLIEEHRPIWNGCLDGFGLHDPGAGRSPIVSWWDAMHPDRPAALRWRATIKRTRTVADAEARLREWLALPEPPVIVDDEDADTEIVT